MHHPSIKDHISSKDWYDIKEAIKADKYWNLAEGIDYIVYALALSRARTPAKSGRYVRATGIGQVIAGEEQYWFCRKYRVLLINVRNKTVISVLTWNAFKIAIKEGEKVIVRLVQSGTVPPYVNYKIMKSLMNCIV
ncbi:MAG: hypothetical protein ACP5TZ_06520 [Nitrososphaeria archaeon]